MAVATTATADISVDTIVALALARAGMLNAGHDPDPEQFSLGRLFLFTSMQALQSRGIIMRAVDRYEQATVAGQAYVDAPADTVSVEAGAIIRNSNGVTELPVEIYTRAEYMRRIVDKTVQGKPLYYFPEKLATGRFRIYLWQVPTADWPTFIYPRERRLADVSTGGVTLDLDPRWHLPVQLWLAADFCQHYGRLAREQSLRAQFASELGIAQDNETERGDAMLVAEPTPWD